MGTTVILRAIRTERSKGVTHRTNRYLNNRIEQDHRGVKGRYGPMRLQKVPTPPPASVVRGFDELRNHLIPVHATAKTFRPTHAGNVFQRGIVALRIMEAA